MNSAYLEKLSEREYLKTVSPNPDHWTSPVYKQRVITKVLRALLLNGYDQIVRGGQICTIRKESLGVGVYDIWYDGTSQPLSARIRRVAHWL